MAADGSVSQGRPGPPGAPRGALYLTASKAWFVATSTAINLLLPIAFGSAAVYGLFVTAFRLLSILNNVLVAATVQTTSKLVSEDAARAPATLRKGLIVQGTFGLALGSALWAGAGPLAARALLDPALAPLFRVGAVVVITYTLYATLVGALNGSHRFGAQASLDATFSALRTAGILGGTAVGLGALGPMIGFAAATAAVLVVALFVVGVGRVGAAPPLGRWASLMAPLWAYQAFQNAILLGDVGVLKRTLADLALAGGATPEAAAATASTYVGYYGAAQNFALVPFQLMLSVTLVAFPAVSRAASLGDAPEVRRVVAGALRFALLLLLAFAAPIAGAADGVMGIVYREEYLAGAGALGILVFGTTALGLFVVCATVLSGAGRPTLAAGIAAFAFAVVVACNRGFVLAVGLGDRTLEAAAAGTALGMGVALLAAATLVRRAYGVFVPAASALRGGAAAAAAFAVARTVPHGTAVGGLAALALGFAAYVAVLVATREVRPAELARLLRRR